jgi:hypothetical protein
MYQTGEYLYPSYNTNHMTVDAIYDALRMLKAKLPADRNYHVDPQDSLDDRDLRFSLNRRGVIVGLAVPALGE